MKDNRKYVNDIDISIVFFAVISYCNEFKQSFCLYLSIYVFIHLFIYSIPFN